MNFSERVAASDLDRWLQDKREGHGRDPRLLAAAPADTASSSGAGPSLFRDVAATFEVGVAPSSKLFDGPSSVDELSSVISSSGMEPGAFCEQFLLQCGVAGRGGLAMELRVLVFAFAAMACIDRLHLPRLSSSEHLARRILQVIRAFRRSPKSPDFEGLEAFMRHMGPSSTGTLRTPQMDKWVVEQQKTEAMISKQARLAKEETALGRGRGAGGGGGAAGAEGNGRGKKKGKKGKKKKGNGEDEDTTE